MFLVVGRLSDKAVVGWNSEPFGGAGMDYIVVKAGDRGIGGIMATPEDVKGVPPMWAGYIYSADADATTASIRNGGRHGSS